MQNEPLTHAEYLALPEEERELYRPETGCYYYSSNFTDENKSKPRPWAECEKYPGFCPTPLTYILKTPVPVTEGEKESLHGIAEKLYPYKDVRWDHNWKKTDSNMQGRDAFIKGYHHRDPEITALQTALAEAQKEIERLKEAQRWKTDTSFLNSMNQERTVVSFDDGSMCFYNDDNWPFAETVGFFELPEPPKRDINN